MDTQMFSPIFPLHERYDDSTRMVTLQEVKRAWARARARALAPNLEAWRKFSDPDSPWPDFKDTQEHFGKEIDLKFATDLLPCPSLFGSYVDFTRLMKQQEMELARNMEAPRKISDTDSPRKDRIEPAAKYVKTETSLADIEAAIKYIDTKNSDQEADKFPDLELGVNMAPACQEMTPLWVRIRDLPHWIRQSVRAHFDYHKFLSSSGSGSSSRLFTTVSWIHNLVTAPDSTSSPPSNRIEASDNANIKIEIFDEDDNHRYNPGVPEVCLRATNSACASPSGKYEVARDGKTDLSAMSDVRPDETKYPTEVNNIILGITGPAALALASSNSSDSPFLHFFVAATAIGFLGSFFANFMKSPKIARILSKIGAIGAASAVIVALGLYLPKDTKWNLNMVATAVACFTTAVVVASA
ncbi:hypothetical protein ACH5RR_030348 [Cinchona calisaya]|uniref:Uncharacterized protein n=1 Tax=Cinchona calisaya TaxID=153742 RepID=A0ABD2YYM3_9GENT